MSEGETNFCHICGRNSFRACISVGHLINLGRKVVAVKGKWIICGSILVAMMSFSLVAKSALVSHVTASQRYPWNGIVDIGFTVTNVIAGKNRLSITFQDVAGKTNLVAKSITKDGMLVVNGVTSIANGRHMVQWDAQRDLKDDCDFDEIRANVSVRPYTYNVKFNSNGGSGVMANEMFDYGTVKSLTANEFVRDGYDFQGWSTSSTGSITYTNAQPVVNLSEVDAAIVELYAIWKKSLGGVQLWENGPYWAECNVGAENPEDDGYYFWWGDTVGYTYEETNTGLNWRAANGSRSGFKFSTDNCPTYGKDNEQLQALGFLGPEGNLSSEHDAATIHLGTPWRMPTNTEINALRTYCKYEKVTFNGVPGVRLIGKGDYASKSIFIPYAGYANESSLVDHGADSRHWIATPNPDAPNSAWRVQFRLLGMTAIYSTGRHQGLSIRPVRDGTR